MKKINYNSRNTQFEYDLFEGVFSINYSNKCTITNVYSLVKDIDGKKVRNTDFKNHVCNEESEITDKFGQGKKFVIYNFNDDSFVLKQVFYIYNEGFAIVKIEVYSEDEYKTNYMAPVISKGKACVKIVGEELKALFVPFDNDKWARFISYPVRYAQESYEFTAIYNENQDNGLIVGSITHDKWKTGIKILGDSSNINSLEVYGGAASEQTRDVLPHGAVSGNTVESPSIFIGYYDSYKEGLKVFGDANAKIKAPLKWDGGVPFGWNSWAALMQTITFDKYIEASDFFSENVQNTYNNKGELYINFDAFWNRMPEEKLIEAFEHVRNNGQKPGIYIGPFITHESCFDEVVDGTKGKYRYRDILLKDHEGNILPPVDGLYSLDPTHNGTLMKLKNEIDKFITLNVDYIKADFLGHAAREGNFCNKEITTGIQAYNYAMQYLVDLLSKEEAGKEIFLSLSIAPIFPHGYGHGRRICCDAFGTIDQSEYLLNSLSYLWWMNGCLYKYNDPDHIVLYKTYDKVATTENEAKTRFNAAVICGTVILNSDDYSYEIARERAKKLFTNDEINCIARSGETFVPFRGNKGDKAADIFIKAERNQVYIALFNYSICEDKQFLIPLSELGLDAENEHLIKDLWSNKEYKVCSVVNIELQPADSTIIKIMRKSEEKEGC
jgi:alpha-galactosidase